MHSLYCHNAHVTLPTEFETEFFLCFSCFGLYPSVCGMGLASIALMQASRC